MEIIVALIGAAFASLIGAVILREAAKWVIKEDVAYGNAYITVFSFVAFNMVIGKVIVFCVGEVGLSFGLKALTLLMLPVGFLIQSAIISMGLKTSFGKACLIALAMTAVIIGILIMVGVIIFVMPLISGMFL